MKQYLETLLKEFRELFPSQKSDKKFEQWLGNLKSLQWSLAPEKEYKENLRSRLEGVYFMDTQEWGLWTSIKTWSNIAGFAFALPLVVYVGYMFFSANTDGPLVKPVWEWTQIESIQSKNISLEDTDGWDGSVNTEESDLPIEIKTPSNILRESDVVGTRVSVEEIYKQEPLNDSEETDSEVLISPKQEINNESIQWDSQAEEVSESNSNSETPKLEDTSWGESFLPEENLPSEDALSDDEYGQDEKSNDIIIAPVVPAVSPLGWEVQWSTSAESSQDFSTDGEQSAEPSFELICLEELWWEIIEDGRICRLLDGTTCDQSEIYTCGTRPKDNEPEREEEDIYLEDYIQEGQ